MKVSFLILSLFCFSFSQDSIISDSVSLTGPRSKESITKVIMRYLSNMRLAYNKRLTDVPKLEGKLFTSFSINEYGKVIYCNIDSSAIKDSILESQIIEQIKSWTFDTIFNPGDIAKVSYAFVFNQNSFPAPTGGRSRESIMKVVMDSLYLIKTKYNKRLRERPCIHGKIIFRFGIDELGKVIFCKVDSSTVKDSTLASDLLMFIKTWQFEPIHKPHDITEVIYPFVFDSNNNSCNPALFWKPSLFFGGIILLAFTLGIVILSSSSK
jgi:hypothetical protein